MRKLRIAQISPLIESVPPKLYGGTERVVAYLTDELVNQGHDVTLFASGDSVTRARLLPITPEALRLKKITDPLAFHVLQLKEVVDRANDYDILHFHTDYLHFPLSELAGLKTITTLHGRLDIEELQQLFNKFSQMPVVSISNAQRKPMPQANWVGTVYHGFPKDLYRQGAGRGNYVAFIGRISPEKRVDIAIEIARQAGVKIKIAAKVDKADEEYFQKYIKHLFNLPHVEYIGEIGENEKNDFLGNAMALLFPIDWPEPFGLVMTEALGCGTPVIAFNRGSVPEIIEDGKTGFIVERAGQAVEALKRIDLLDRDTCRATFETRFSAAGMAKKYTNLYSKILETDQSSMLEPVPVNF